MDPSSAPPSDPLTTRPVARGDRSNQLVPLKAASCGNYERDTEWGEIMNRRCTGWTQPGALLNPCGSMHVDGGDIRKHALHAASGGGGMSGFDLSDLGIQREHVKGNGRAFDNLDALRTGWERAEEKTGATPSPLKTPLLRLLRQCHIQRGPLRSLGKQTCSPNAKNDQLSQWNPSTNQNQRSQQHCNIAMTRRLMLANSCTPLMQSQEQNACHSRRNGAHDSRQGDGSPVDIFRGTGRLNCGILCINNLDGLLLQRRQDTGVCSKDGFP
jgi:hypothetical protein